jgi:hypothetical protein
VGQKNKKMQKRKLHPSLTILGGWLCQSLTQGVGKNNFTMNKTRYKNASLKGTSRGLATMLEKEEKGEFRYPIKGGAFEVLCDRKWAA